MTAFVELPLVSEATDRSVWVNPAQVGSVEQGAPTKPGTCWVTMVWGCRHQIALPQSVAVDALQGDLIDPTLRESVRENLTR